MMVPNRVMRHNGMIRHFGIGFDIYPSENRFEQENLGMKSGIIIACLVAVSLTGCGQVRKIIPKPVQQNTSAQHINGPITLSGSPNLSSPSPIRQTAPQRQNWRRDLPRNIAYFNMGEAPITIYGEAAQATPSGTLLPGEGGYIQSCDDDKPICKLNFGNGRTGWISMNSMAGVSG